MEKIIDDMPLIMAGFLAKIDEFQTNTKDAEKFKSNCMQMLTLAADAIDYLLLAQNQKQGEITNG